MAKGVLGNDPFQRGAAQRPSESKPAGTAPAQEPKKAPAAPAKKAAPAKAAKKASAPKEKPAARAAAPKPAASKPAAPKPATGARAKTEAAETTPTHKAAPKHAAGAKAEAPETTATHKVASKPATGAKAEAPETTAAHKVASKPAMGAHTKTESTSPAAHKAAPKPAVGAHTKAEAPAAPKPSAGAHAKTTASEVTGAPKTTTPKPSGARAKKAEPSRAEGAKPTTTGKTEAPEPTTPRAEVRTPAEAVIAAGAELGVPTEPTRAEARAEEKSSVQEPRAPGKPAAPAEPPEAREPVRPESAEELEAEAELLERVAETVAAAEAIRELEETLGEALPTGPVAVPGFENVVTARVTETVVVEVLDRSQDEHAPSSEAEAEEEARIEVEVEAALAPALPASSHTDAFFTSESPGAEPHRLGDRFSGLLSLAKDMAFQALASERFGKTVGSAQGLVGAALTGIGVGGGTAIDEYGKDATLSGVLQPVLDFFYERYWRVSVQGASHVPAGPVLLVANHSGALPIDGPMLQQALSRERPDLQEARWLAEDQVFHAPMLGTLMNRLGAVRACPENALRLLDELRPVIVFPEGIQGLSKPFAQRYQLKRFGRGGFVKLALRTGAPIVPVAIVGAEETAPLFGKIPASFLGIPYLPLTPPPLPARWTIRFGDPISMGELPPEAADDMSQVQRLTERTRESIQGMLQALLKDRRSVFAG